MNPTDFQAVTIRRAQALSAHANSIRDLEAQESEAVLAAAWIAVQLGCVYREAKEAWKGAKGEQQSWRVWIEGDEQKKVKGHSRHSLRTVQEYMQMSEIWEATEEAQRAALLRRGSIRGFFEEAAQLKSGNETGEAKSFPDWTTSVNQLGKWKDKFLTVIAEIPEASADKFVGDFMAIMQAVKARWPERFE